MSNLFLRIDSQPEETGLGLHSAPASTSKAVKLQQAKGARLTPAPQDLLQPGNSSLPAIASTSDHRPMRQRKGSSYRLHNTEFLAFLYFLDLVHILEGGLKEIVSLFVYLKVSLEERGKGGKRKYITCSLKIFDSLLFVSPQIVLSSLKTTCQVSSLALNWNIGYSSKSAHFWLPSFKDPKPLLTLQGQGFPKAHLLF